MRIEHIHIEGYRSLTDVDIRIAGETQILCIVGKNGLGKTNILEALYMLSISKPFRGKRLQEIVQENADLFQVKSTWHDGEQGREIAVFGVRRPFERQFHLDGRPVTPMEVVGKLPMVLFHPGDLGEFVSSPGYRRRYMNVLASQVDPTYTRTLVEYTKVLKQRNSLLRTIRMGEGDVKELEFWDDALARAGAWIVAKRLQLLDFFGAYISDVYSRLAGESVEVRCTYSTTGCLQEAYTEENLRRELEQRRDKDISYVATTVGPHRDDIALTMHGKDVFRFASRGELRTLLLSLKLLEIKYIELVTGNTPVLLLDDVFSELDMERQERLLQEVAHVQTILTVTHTEPLDVTHEAIQVVRIEELLGEETF